MSDLSLIQNDDIRDSLLTLSRVGKRRKFDVPRWNNVMDKYKKCGTVSIPIRLMHKDMAEPFYFVFEKVNDQEFLMVRPMKGQPWSQGSVYGFFGLHAFKDFKIGDPIILVEGIADWAPLFDYYRHVLCVLGAKLTVKQQFFLSNLTKTVWMGYDNDDAGNKAYESASKALERFGVTSHRLLPSMNDWGEMYEDDWGRRQLDVIMKSFLRNK